MKKVDPFVQAPEFLAAFNNVAKNGFFGEIKFSGLGSEGRTYSCSIEATGHIPNDTKYAEKGFGVLVDPEAIIMACKAVTGRHEVRKVYVAVTTENWDLYDRTGNSVVGVKGTTTKMQLCIYFSNYYPPK